MNALAGYIKAVATQHEHIDSLKYAIEYGRGVVVKIDESTYGVAYRVQGTQIYRVSRIEGEKINTVIVVYYSTVITCMNDIAPYHEWQPIKG